MKKTITTFLLSLSLAIIPSCSVQKKAITGNRFRFSIQAGSNIGGITENTDMSVVPGVQVPPEAIVDAFSGATHPGFNAGVHISRKMKMNHLETGLDYMYNHQTFNYIDAGNKYTGVRELHVSQLILPFTYNMVLFGKLFPEADMQLKAGLICQLNFVSGKGVGILPDYSANPLSAGPILGFALYPLSFENGNKIGIYIDFYRGSQIYKDFYNQPDFEMPGSSFAKFGLTYKF